MSRLRTISDLSQSLIPILLVLVLVPVAFHLWIKVFEGSHEMFQIGNDYADSYLNVSGSLDIDTR